jgi:hypothetical protein
MSWSFLIKLSDRSVIRHCNIYALVDPRELKCWRYVGRSFHPLSRRVQHVRGGGDLQRGATYKETWIGQLLSEGIQPCVIVLEECASLSEAIAREKIWISRALADGHPLTNSALLPKSSLDSSLKQQRM